MENYLDKNTDSPEKRKDIPPEHYLDRESLKIKNFFEKIIQENPELGGVKLSFFKPADIFELGGYYSFEEGSAGELAPVVNVSCGPPEDLAPLFEIRKESVNIIASLMGMPPQSLTAEFLRKFIVAHELGHIRDFVKNYEKSPEYGSVWEAEEEMYFHRQSMLGSLPVPNVYPSDLVKEVRTLSSVKELLLRYPNLINHPRFGEMNSLSDVVRVQEEEYRNSAAEKYADWFAVSVMKKVN